MYCKHCGKTTESQHLFCPSCGVKFTEENTQTVQDQKNSRWFKILLGMILVGVCVAIGIALFSIDMTDTVTNQLKAIKTDKIPEAYFDYTSKGFQETTSLKQFHEFIKTYPEIAHSRSIRFIDRKAYDDTGDLQAMLTTDQGNEIPIQYRLVKEGEKWKILSIKLEAKSKKAFSPIKHQETFDSKPLIEVIEKQVEKIRQNNLSNAYQNYTSKDFQKSTSLEDFEAFVKSQPSLSENNKVEMGNLSFDNNVATFSGVLTTKNGTRYPAEYSLIQEDGVWKILHIQMKAPEVQKDSSVLEPMKISKFLLGVAVDDAGYVETPVATFKTNSGDIYLNLYLNNAKAGTKVEVAFEHIQSHSTIPSVSSTVSEDGDSVVTFIFSPPPKSGWPKGNYRLVATTSTGLTNTYEFNVED